MDAHLMLIHRLLPDYEQHIVNFSKKSKSVRNNAINQWQKTATEALLKHPLFDELVWDPKLSTEDQVKKYHDIASHIIKKFQNHKNQKIDKKEPTVATAITQDDEDEDNDQKDNTASSLDCHQYKLLFQLLKFSGSISGQKIFDNENKDAIAARSCELHNAGEVKGGNPGAADQKALKELWLQLSDDEREEYERRALEAKRDIFRHEVPVLLYELLKELQDLIGPAVFMLVFAFCNEADAISSGCVNVSFDASQKIKDILNADFGAQVQAWADICLPHEYHACSRPQRSLQYKFVQNIDGIVLFPHVDLQQTPLTKVKVLIDKYFYSLWGCYTMPRAPYANIATNPAQYYDVSRWPSLPLISCPPSEMGAVETIMMSTYLKDNSSEGALNPFYFHLVSPDHSDSTAIPPMLPTAGSTVSKNDPIPEAPEHNDSPTPEQVEKDDDFDRAQSPKPLEEPSSPKEDEDELDAVPSNDDKPTEMKPHQPDKKGLKQRRGDGKPNQVASNKHDNDKNPVNDNKPSDNDSPGDNNNPGDNDKPCKMKQRSPAAKECEHHEDDIDLNVMPNNKEEPLKTKQHKSAQKGRWDPAPAESEVVLL
ncbi:hypothetical protein IW262DRAFT_1465909 [Armillaria fumosa]|nr:hypothetical protein IW262DRAFT_1465909 [Armillaria fumosa]